MFKDSNSTFQDSLRSDSGSLESESFCPYNGHIFFKVTDESGNVTESGDFKNVVTRDAGVTIARLMKSGVTSTPNVSIPKFGAFALAVGTGALGWDPKNPPLGTRNQRSLYNEVARKPFSSSNFIDENGAVVSYPTNTIDLVATFLPGEAAGPLMELGILGGDVNPNMAIRNPVLPPNGVYDPTVDLAGKDALLNYKTIKLFTVASNASVSWTWRLTF